MSKDGGVGMTKQPRRLVKAVIKEVDRLAAMTPDVFMMQEGISMFELLDYCITLRNEIEGGD